MPALRPTSFKADIHWVGRVPDSSEGLRSAQFDAIDLDFAGIVGERHSGLTRPSCSRVLSQHPRNTEIANARQLAVMSVEEMQQIAKKMGLETLKPEWLGISMLVRGIPDFSHVPPSSRLQAENGTTLVVDMENRPCVLPGREIEIEHPGFGKLFKTAAQNVRGVTAWVERGGQLKVGDTLTLHVPDQPIWACLDEARKS